MHRGGELAQLKDGDDVVKGLGRAPSGAIINTDKASFENFKAARAAKLREKEELNSMRQEIDNLKGIIEELVSFIKSAK